MPVSVDEKEVKRLGVARGGRDFGEASLSSEAVDERGLAHVGAPDEGEFRDVRVRASIQVGGADYELSGANLHAGSSVELSDRIGFFDSLKSLDADSHQSVSVTLSVKLFLVSRRWRNRLPVQSG